MKRYLLILILFVGALAPSFGQQNIGNSPAKADTSQLKKTEAPSRAEESIPTSATVKSKATKAPIQSKLQDEPSTADSQNQSQASFYYSNFQTALSQSKNNLYQRTPTPQIQQKLDASSNYFNTNLPNGFEANFMTYKAGNYDQQNYSHLETAINLQPNNNEVQVEYGLANYIQTNNEVVDSMTTCLTNSGYFTAGVLQYASDIVQSVPTDGTLLIHGTTDLLPVNQAKTKLGRTDLEIISLDLLQSEQYQMQLAGLGYQLPESNIIDTAYVKSFCLLNENKQIFLSMGFPKYYLEPIQKDLTVLGLTMGYKITGLDVYNWNLNLYRFVWNRQQLAQVQDLRSNTLSANYLPALMNLQKQFEWYNRTKDYQEISALIEAIGLRANKTKAIKSIGK